MHKKQTEFPKVRDDLRKARSNFTASQSDQSEAVSLFQPTTNNERAWPRVPQSSSSRLSCAKEKSSGVENGTVLKGLVGSLKIATAGATTAAVTQKVWGEYVAAVCQILAKRDTKMSETSTKEFKISFI